MASLCVVNGTLECPPQEDEHPYRDLLGGFSKHLQDALFPRWITGRGSTTPWVARIVGAEWAGKWGRWCVGTRATGTPAQQYAAIPLEGWGPHTQPQPTMIRGAGPEHPWDAAAVEWLQAAPERHVGCSGDVSSLIRAPSPPASFSTPPTCSKSRGYTHGDATRPPSSGSPRRARPPSSPTRISEMGGLCTTTPCPGRAIFSGPCYSCSHRPCSRATQGAGQLRKTEGRLGGDRGRHPSGPPPPECRGQMPVGRSDAPPRRGPHLYGNPSPGAPPAGRAMTTSPLSTTTGSSQTTRDRRSGRRRSAGTTGVASAPAY